MKRSRRTVPVAVLLCVLWLAAASFGQRVGGALPEGAISDLTNTEAKSLADFRGRLLLIEYFAYW